MKGTDRCGSEFLAQAFWGVLFEDRDAPCGWLCFHSGLERFVGGNGAKVLLEVVRFLTSPVGGLDLGKIASKVWTVLANPLDRCDSCVCVCVCFFSSNSCPARMACWVCF